ncbi:hypothetical protein BDY21DRAFT_197440 [Lineolata rhizophorae]|uniref:Uncharacterized protein n=1 Tax=Lineolata rhizophorae TaxID=578093 RepID=A0A6A6P557_9PEZI|nr:hypothetical protein BDY21DRAFT_197440 [Lineolata rhizophorae]
MSRRRPLTLRHRRSLGEYSRGKRLESRVSGHQCGLGQLDGWPLLDSSDALAGGGRFGCNTLNRPTAVVPRLHDSVQTSNAQPTLLGILTRYIPQVRPCSTHHCPGPTCQSQRGNSTPPFSHSLVLADGEQLTMPSLGGATTSSPLRALHSLTSLGIAPRKQILPL